MVRTSMICEVYSINKQSRKGQKVDSWHCQRFFNYIIAGKKPEYLGGGESLCHLASYRQTLSHKVISNKPRNKRILNSVTPSVEEATDCK